MRPNDSPPLLIPSSAERLPLVTHGDGVYLFDADGKSYLDGASGAVAAGLGHGNEALVEALTSQSKQVAFAHRTQFRNQPSEQLAALIASRTPGDLNHSFFSSSGSEANELAMRFALAYWEEKGLSHKRGFVSRRTSYHGSTLGALSLTGQMSRRNGLEGLLHAYPILHPEGGPWPGADVLEDELSRVDPRTVAAIVTEPVGGASGLALVPEPGYHSVLRRWCTENQVLWIADEVMSGFGRTGSWFAVEHDGEVPDILSFGKGVSGGYGPLSGVTMTEEVAAGVLRASSFVSFGHTYSNSPIAAAIGVATVQEIERCDLVRNAFERGEQLEVALRSIADRFQLVKDSRGRGLLRGIEFHSPVARGMSRNGSLTSWFVARAREYGLLLYPGGKALYADGHGEGVMIAPPLIVTDQQVEKIVSRFESALSDATNEWLNS